jgi:type IV pilus assembly protein PilV
MSVRAKQGTPRTARRTFQRGSMMVEVLVSVVLLSVSVLGLVRVLGQSVKDSGELEYRSVASTLADQTIGRMWVTDPATLNTYAATNTGTITDLPSGTRTVTYNAATKVITVTIAWQAPGATASQYRISATLSRN